LKFSQNYRSRDFGGGLSSSVADLLQSESSTSWQISKQTIWLARIVELDGCIVLTEHNTVFARNGSVIRAHAVYFLHSTMPSVTFLRPSDVSVICRVTYFQFPIQSAFLPYIGRQAAPTLRRTTYWFWYAISDIERCRKFVYVLILCGTYSLGERLELILTLKMETRHPVDGLVVIFRRSVITV